MINTVSTRLRDCIDAGHFFEDTAQIDAAKALDDLLTRIEAQPVKKKSFFSREMVAPKGIYMWGGVGRGKSMLMDLFFDVLECSDKKRVHFHEFMADVHGLIHKLRQR